MSLTELFRSTSESCEICKTGVRDSPIESHGKSFCSIECMQEYLIQLKEAEMKNQKTKIKQMKFLTNQK